jgi:UDP-glucuronate 4-epimerase
MTAESKNDTHILVTGAAGFIGFHFTKRLLLEGYTVTGVDNMNEYYEKSLKLDRLKQLGFSDQEAGIIAYTDSNMPIYSTGSPGLGFYGVGLEDKEMIDEVFENEKPRYVVHFAAQAGVRYSLENPYAYIDSNINGFMNILENCRRHDIGHLLFSSSSSVYGANESMPYSEHHNVDHPVSLYAATKKSNELMAHAYAHLYKIPCTGLRFFTVYGPWGRPDMAYFSFTRKIMAGESIQVFNQGDMKRDFTYIDDIVEGVYRVMLKIPGGDPEWNGLQPDPASSRAPYRVFNIGNNKPVPLPVFIELLEKHLGKTARKEFLPFQKGDVKETYADIDALDNYVGFKPATTIEEGIARFVEWYKEYYGTEK